MTNAPLDDDALEALRARIAAAREEVAAGKTISNDDMKRWLRSWGTDDELDPP